MVEFVEINNEFPKDLISSDLFLTSLRDFQKDGVEMGVKSVSKPFANGNDDGKCKIAVGFNILGDFPKCRVYVLENNQYVESINPKTGEKEREIDFADVTNNTVTFYLNLNKAEKSAEINDGTEVNISELSSSYPLIRACFVRDDLLPEDGKGSIKATIGEIRESLSGMNFIGEFEHLDGKFKYNRLQVKEVLF